MGLWFVALSCTICVGTPGEANAATGPQDWSTQYDKAIGGEPGTDDALPFLLTVRTAADGTTIAVVQARRVTVWDSGHLSEPVLELWPRDDVAQLGSPRNIQVDSTGLWVRYDRGIGRFLLDGRLVRTMPSPPDEWLQGGIVVLGDGTLLARGRFPFPHQVFNWELGHPGWQIAVAHLRLADDGWMADTVAMFDSSGRTLGLAVHRNQMFSSQPFADHDLMYWNRQAGAVGIVNRNMGTGDVGVVEVGPGQDTVLASRVRLPLSRLGRERVEAAIASHMQRISRRLRSSDDSLAASTLDDLVEAALHIPDHLPPVTAVVATASNEIWLRSSEPNDSMAVWYAINRTQPTSRPRRVFLPERFMLRDASHTHVWGLHVDRQFAGQVHGRRLVPIG